MARKRAASAASAPAAKKARASPLADAVICITGTLSVPRKQLVGIIQENGGSVSGSVTGKTTHLVADAGAQGTTKWNKAKQVGIPIITEDDLNAVVAGERSLDGDESAPPPAGAPESPVTSSAEPISLSGAVVCITGTLSVPRKQLVSFIESNGGKVSASVTGKTTHLVADAGAQGTAKWNKAKQVGIPIITEEQLREGLLDGEADAVMEDADDEPSAEEAEEAAVEEDGQALEGMVICQTGKLSVTRKEFIQLIEDNGGSVSSSVTKKTTHLVADAGAEGTAKWNKASSLGIPIMTESEIRTMIGEDGSEDDSCDEFDDINHSSEALKANRIPPTVDWSLSISSVAYGIFVDSNGMWAGLESGELYHIAPETGQVLKIVKVSDGCKCIVGDMGWIYCGCNDGKVYDITNPVEPRLMYELDTSEQIQWMDICDGFVAVSTENGNVSQVNAEGDEVWSHNHGSLCGWMVRSDMQGVYHGAGSMVRKYAFRTGKLEWETSVSSDIMFGAQTQDDLLAAHNSLSVIEKKTGYKKCERKSPSDDTFPSAILLEDGRMFGSLSGVLVAYDKDQNFDFTMALPGDAMSMQYYDGYLYCVSYGHIFRVAVDGKVLANARKGKSKAATAVKASKKVETVEMKTDVEAATGSEDGIVVKCVKEGSKVRVRPVSTGYHSTWNVQFPRALRKPGAQFVVEELIEAQSGGFYRTKGSIKRLA